MVVYKNGYKIFLTVYKKLEFKNRLLNKGVSIRIKKGTTTRKRKTTIYLSLNSSLFRSQGFYSLSSSRWVSWPRLWNTEGGLKVTNVILSDWQLTVLMRKKSSKHEIWMKCVIIIQVLFTQTSGDLPNKCRASELDKPLGLRYMCVCAGCVCLF